MWILINWMNDDGSDILPVNDKVGDEAPKKFGTEKDALEWAKENINFNYKAIQI